MKILIINEFSRGSSSASSITLRNFLQNYNEKDILEISFEKDKTGQYNSLLYPTKYQPLRYVSRLLFFQKANSALKTSTSKVSTTVFRQFLISLVDSSPFFLPKNFLLEIKNFNPDIIFTYGSGLTVLRLVNKIYRIIKKPIVFHIMDNWIDFPQWNNNILLKHYHKNIRKMFFHLIKFSPISFAISKGLSDYLNNYKKGVFFPLYNSIKSNFMKPNFSIKKKIILSYFGGLHLGRSDALFQLSNYIYYYFTDKKINYDLRVYSKDFPKFNGLKHKIKFYNQITHNLVQKEIEKTDVLLLIEPLFNKNKFNQFSISTKTAEYLASGKIILYFGSFELYLYKYLTENESGVFSYNQDSLNKSLDFVLDSKKRKYIIEKSLLLYEKNHKSSNNIKFFISKIKASISKMSNFIK